MNILEGRSGGRHDADQVLGHLQHHHTRQGKVIRYHRRSGLVLDIEVGPETDPNFLRKWATILGQAALLIVLLGSIVAFSAILAAAQTLPPVPR